MSIPKNIVSEREERSTQKRMSPSGGIDTATTTINELDQVHHSPSSATSSYISADDEGSSPRSAMSPHHGQSIASSSSLLTKSSGVVNEGLTSDDVDVARKRVVRWNLPTMPNLEAGSRSPSPVDSAEDEDMDDDEIDLKDEQTTRPPAPPVSCLKEGSILKNRSSVLRKRMADNMGPTFSKQRRLSDPDKEQPKAVNSLQDAQREMTRIEAKIQKAARMELSLLNKSKKVREYRQKLTLEYEGMCQKAREMVACRQLQVLHAGEASSVPGRPEDDDSVVVMANLPPLFCPKPTSPILDPHSAIVAAAVAQGLPLLGFMTSLQTPTLNSMRDRI